MSGKSRHGRRGHAAQSKKRKGKRSPQIAVAQQQVVTPTHESVAPPEVSTPSVSVPTPRATPTVARYPYITSELRRIGILAGIILVILVVLTQALP